MRLPTLLFCRRVRNLLEPHSVIHVYTIRMRLQWARELQVVCTATSCCCLRRDAFPADSSGSPNQAGWTSRERQSWHCGAGDAQGMVARSLISFLFFFSSSSTFGSPFPFPSFSPRGLSLILPLLVSPRSGMISVCPRLLSPIQFNRVISVSSLSYPLQTALGL